MKREQAESMLTFHNKSWTPWSSVQLSVLHRMQTLILDEKRK